MNMRNYDKTLFLCSLACAVAFSATATANGVNPDTGGLAGVDSDGDGVHDNIDAEPCNLQVSARAMVPADRVWGMLLFEDMWPDRGDFDFNDLVLAYNETIDYDASANVRGLRMDLRVMAVGARQKNGLAVRLPGLAKGDVTFLSVSIGGQGQNVVLRAGESEAVVDLASDLHALFGADQSRAWVNTDTSLPAQPYVDIVVKMQFATGNGLSGAEAPFDIFIFNTDTGAEVHLPRYNGSASLNGALIGTGDDATTAQRAFVTTNGIPFALEFPEQVVYPKENLPIDQLFPTIVEFGSSNGSLSTDFFRNATSGQAYGNVSPGTLSAAAAVDVSCFLPDPGICGAAAGTGSVNAPTGNLCSNGAASAPTTSGGLHRWTCAGNYAAPINCDAPDWACVPNVASDCSGSIANGSGTHTCNGSGTGFNTCTLTSCNSGFYTSGNTCIAQVCTPNQSASCAIANGTGSKTCNNIGSGYGGCALQSCNSGFTAVAGACQAVTPTGTNVYYQCQNAVSTSANTGYVVFVQNVENLRTNDPAELLTACLHYGFKGLATSDSRTHYDNGWGINNSSEIHQAVYCHNCYPSSGNEWYYNRSSHNSCTHSAGVAAGTRDLNMATYIYNSDDTTFACMTFDEDLDSSTAFGNGATNDATHPWYTESSGQDPCNRTRVRFGDNYDGTPDYLLCASQTIQN